MSRNLTIIGGGVIGKAWATSFLRGGWNVTITDNQDLSETLHDEFNGKVKFISDLEESVINADYVQENGPERLSVKQDIFYTLAKVAPAHTVFASSSSSIVASKIAENNPAADRILIGHPFNPANIMPLVEVVPSPKTSATSINQAMNIYLSLGYQPILIRKEIGGFVGNRLQVAFLNECRYLVEQGVITVGDLDRLVLNSLGLRWSTVGPFEAQHLGGGPEGIRHLLNGVGAGLDITLGKPDPDKKEEIISA
ncbi:3-hydroxyacyl-CoA dehydrogenase NAD-binding domain-containing protein, partial [Proteus myxofaciens]|uniref:3-hydroxyacyl-CoA dehydrogenase NAD-binding domain-containing protein n=1 Tax=Proteus myxofaciens TaxID=184072 RepID=UPI00082CCFA3